MNNRITFGGIIFILMGLFVSISAQQLINITNQSTNPPMISGGAESSILLEKLKRLDDNALQYKGEISVVNPTSVSSPSATSSISTIEGINFDEDAALNGFYHIPPDPIGVIGPNHLVAVNNTSIEWFTKAGINQNSQTLQSFFASVSPLTATFDPKVIYDQYEDRFVVVTLERQFAPDPLVSKIFIAVSQTSDPNAGWYFYAIDSKTDIGGSDYWADYPGFAVCEEAVYITNNMFAFADNAYGGTRLWIVDKGVSGGFYGGGATSVNIYDPFTTSGSFALTSQPAHIFGTAPLGIGTYLAGYSRLQSGSNSILQLLTINNPLSSPTFTLNFINMGVVDDLATPTPNAPQMGSTTEIETNDPRTYNAVWRNNKLYVSTIVVPPTGDPDAGQATAHWVQVNTSTYTLEDNGNIGGEDIGVGTHTFFPSIAVNGIGEIVVGFSASGPTIYPGAYYTFRFPYDASGTVKSSKTLRAGDDYYERTFGGSRNRWGDYSGSSVDPTNDITFCLFNEYAFARGTLFGGEDGRWGTVFGITPQLTTRVLLEGAFAGVDGTFGGYMSGSADYTLTQPYNTAPWNYPGLETLATKPPNMLDWVLVTLKQDLDPLNPDPTTSVVVARRAGLIHLLGHIYDLGGEGFPLAFSVEPGDYYIQVEHRNHLSVMSPTKVTITN